MQYHHQPVLLNEVLEFLKPKHGQNYIDATLGGGGYTQAILERVKPNGQVLAIDLDEEAIQNTRNQISNSENLILHHGNFRDIDAIVKQYNFSKPDGIVADIGLSSYQLDQAERGISFQKNEVLDMRFDKSSSQPDAKFILNNYEEEKLLKIFRNYGEEKFAKQIANKVLGLRTKGEEIKYTTDLYKIIKDALPKPVKHRANDSARRIFQALRIEVNQELENLESFLPQAFEILKSGGRLAVVSFHSLEDRIVKQFFANICKGCICPIDFPICVCKKTILATIETKKPILASENEKIKNPRSISAKLRVIKKI